MFFAPKATPKPEIQECECDLTQFVSSDKVICLNEKRDGSGQQLCITTTRLQSDCDEQLILVIPFSEVVTLSSLILGVPPNG